MSTAANGRRPIAGFWAGGVFPTAGTDGTNLDVVTTETYLSAVTIPATVLATGVILMNGGAAAGNLQAAVLDAAGNVLATTASTAQGTTDTTQTIAFTGTVVLPGPATYYIAVQGNHTGADLNTIIYGAAPAGKITSTTYGTFTGLTPPTSFTTGLGVISAIY